MSEVSSIGTLLPESHTTGASRMRVVDFMDFDPEVRERA